MSTDASANRPDLYIGLVCPAGTNLTEVKAQLEAQLSVVGYSCTHIKVSELIKEVLDIEDRQNEFERIRTLMKAGDCIRRNSIGAQGVASIIVAHLRQLRGESEESSSNAYIIDSLKNPSEIDLLDRIYGRNFYTVSVYLPSDERHENLKNKIAKSLHEPPSDKHGDLASVLIKEDEKGSTKTDQNVRDTFPLGDYFINAKADIRYQVNRFVNLLFQEPYTTPTRDEYFMFVAKATALRSCDLSRQVGAVIVNQDGWLLATGCNEVPLPGGGHYDESLPRSDDNRDRMKQYDPNYIEIQRTVTEFIGLLRSAGIITEDEEDSAIVDKLLHGEFKELTSDARIRNLIEFGRVVHAEMHALSQAAAAGRAVKGATLYCTTFPCHGCARHLIAAGIAEVVYVEPYPKSLTLHLYGNEIEVAHAQRARHTVRVRQPLIFRSFHGVSPTLYQRVFGYRNRKDALGTIADWKPRAAIPVGAVFGVERLKLEVAASQGIAKIIESAKEHWSNGVAEE